MRAADRQLLPVGLLLQPPPPDRFLSAARGEPPPAQRAHPTNGPQGAAANLKPQRSRPPFCLKICFIPSVCSPDIRQQAAAGSDPGVQQGDVHHEPVRTGGFPLVS